MKILHTGDFHAGKTLHGLDRTPEIQAALDQILDIAQREYVDLILAAGDLFDNRNPSAEAERVINRFLLLANRASIPVVGIAGNHDSPGRIDALDYLAQANNTDLLGHPQRPGDGGLWMHRLANTPIVIARLPFISHRQAIDLGNGESYQEKMGRLIGALTKDMTDESVNILLAHGTIEGAVLGGSEYIFHSGADYTISLDGLNPHVQYVAMGHIHKAQTLKGSRGEYCGSIIPLDFGEAKYEQSVTIVEVEPGKKAYSERVPLTPSRKLVEVHTHASELDDATLNEYGEMVWDNTLLKLVVDVDTPTPGLRERLRKALPNALIIQVNQPEQQGDEEQVNPAGLSLEESFTHYAEPSEELLTLFRELHREVVE